MGRAAAKSVSLSDVYRLLRRDDISIVIRHLRGVSGWWHPDGTIEIDPRGEFLLVLLHECIHELRPEWPEQKCDAEAARLLAGMTQRQIRNLLARLAARL